MVMTEERVRAKVEELRSALERRKVEGLDLAAALDLEAAARLALERRSRPVTLPTGLIEARMDRLRPAWEATAADRGLPADEANLRAFASQTLDESPLIIIETHGFLDLRYTIHLSAEAVIALNDYEEVFDGALKTAAAEFPELMAIMIALRAFIVGEVGAINSVSKTTGGPVKLEGIFPSPFAFPFPEDDDFWRIVEPAPSTEDGDDDDGGVEVGTITDDGDDGGVGIGRIG
jgi:hypothetical protein